MKARIPTVTYNVITLNLVHSASVLRWGGGGALLKGTNTGMKLCVGNNCEYYRVPK